MNRMCMAARGLTLPALVCMWWAATARAELRFEQPVVQAGMIRSGALLTHRYVFINQGSEAAEILTVRGSCGCLKPQVEQRIIPAGQQGAVVLEVNTLNPSPGHHNWRVFVQYRCDGIVRETTLHLIGHVTNVVTVQPATLTVFTDRGVGHEIMLTDQRPRPLEIAEVRSSSPGLKGRVSEQLRDSSGNWTRKISLEVSAEYPAGRHDEVLEIITDDPEFRDLKVPVTVVKRATQRLSVLPAEVSLRVAPGLAVPSRIVLVRDSEDEVVEIDRVESDHPAIQAAFARGPNNLSTLRLIIDRNRVPGTQVSGVLKVHVKAPVRETLSLPVSCTLE